jgi:tetratricopeptide (TPR) repeat protein
VSLENVPSPNETARTAFLHREILQLAVLIVAAVLLFFGTRAVAASNRRMRLRDAAEWSERGERALAAARLDEGLYDFRRAAALFRQAGDCGNALDQFQRVLRLRPQDAAALAGAGACAFQLGQYDLARRYQTR